MSPKKKEIFNLFFNLETLEISSVAGSTIPNFLMKKISKNFQPNSKRYLHSICSRVASQIEQKSAISFEKDKKQESSLTFDLDKIFA